MTQHKISWLNMPGYKPETWNPIIGCSKVSPGCDNCYAEKMAFRLLHMPFTDYYAFVMDDNRKGDPEEFKYIPKWNGKTHLVKQALNKPLNWKAPRMVFVCSMGDLFHESISFETIELIYDIMYSNHQHIFIVLTKRPERMHKFWAWLLNKIAGVGIQDVSSTSTDNIWIGVTAENQEQANKRIPVLLQIPASKRFVSVEPMLGPVDLTNGFDYENEMAINFLNGDYWTSPRQEGPCHDDSKLDWVICGGETGHKSRPINQNWAIELKNQCKKANVPFFFKQWGEWEPRNVRSFALLNDPRSEKFPLKKVPYADNPFEFSNVSKVGRKNAGNVLDGQLYHEWPTT